MATTRVVVHVGPMKTGTTAIGAYFSAAHSAGVLPSDVVYPAGDLWFPASGSITKHGQLADSLIPRRTPARRAVKRRFKPRITSNKKFGNLRRTSPRKVGRAEPRYSLAKLLVGRANLRRLVDLLKDAFDEVIFRSRRPFPSRGNAVATRSQNQRMEVGSRRLRFAGDAQTPQRFNCLRLSPHAFAVERTAHR